MVLDDGWAEKTLEEAGLCPASTLAFAWDEGIVAEWAQAGVPPSYLKPALMPQ